jgi:hypothetical protein
MRCCGQCVHRETVDIHWKEFECGIDGHEIESLVDKCEHFAAEEAGPKLRCIIKRPDEPYGHVTNISATLHNLQNTVGGYIEVVPVNENDVIVLNEEGKLQCLDQNMPYRVGTDMLVGTIIVIGTKGSEFDDLAMDFKSWKEYVNNQWKEWNG